jgi:hypothetical protein
MPSKPESRHHEKPPCLYIEPDRQGGWSVRESRGLCGGLFPSRRDAIRFAMQECLCRPESVILKPQAEDLNGESGVEGLGLTGTT